MQLLRSLQRHSWALAVTGVFVVQNHCGMPGIEHSQLAVHLLERGQFERALREARRAVREDAQDSNMRVVTALAEAGLGRYEQSVGALAGALRRDPNDVRIYSTLRSLCGQQDCAEIALGALQELSRTVEDNWYVQANLGWAWAINDDPDQALILLEEAVGDLPPEVDESEQIFAHRQLSRLYLDTERFADAARVLEGALMLRPQDPRLLIGIGECQLREGEEDGAQIYFERALEAAENTVETASLIAQVHYNTGLPRRAIQYYEVAAQQRLVTPLILNNLAWTYAEEGIGLERAEDLSLRAVKADAVNVVYLDTYAEVQIRQGRTGRAIALMKRAIALEPEGGEHFEYLRGQLVRFESESALNALGESGLGRSPDG